MNEIGRKPENDPASYYEESIKLYDNFDYYIVIKKATDLAMWMNCLKRKSMSCYSVKQEPPTLQVGENVRVMRERLKL